MEKNKKEKKIFYKYTETGNFYTIVQNDCILNLYKNGKFAGIIFFNELFNFVDRRDENYKNNKIYNELLK